MTDHFAAPVAGPASGADIEAPPRESHAQLTNMALAMRTLMDCADAGSNMPRLGVFYGFSGYGKTVSAAFAASYADAAYIEAKSIWTQRSLLNALAAALGIVKVARTGPLILDQIIEHLNQFPRPLVIDEMDYLVKKQMVDIIRDIHDATNIGIMMIGEEALPAKLKEWERFDNRILVSTAAQPASADDALKLRDYYCDKVAISDDLVIQFQLSCGGVTRRIVTNLENAQKTAVEAGALAIDLAWWGKRKILNGDLPIRRRFS